MNPFINDFRSYIGLTLCRQLFELCRNKQFEAMHCGDFVNFINLRLLQIEAKYEVDKSIIQELNSKLSITISGFEKLTEELGKAKIIEFSMMKWKKFKRIKKKNMPSTKFIKEFYGYGKFNYFFSCFINEATSIMSEMVSKKIKSSEG